MWEVAIKGFMTSASLIVAIGSQNAFVLRQGLKKEHVFAVAFLCFICDFILMSFGVFAASAVTGSPFFTKILAGIGSIFLFWYGLRSLKSAWRAESFLAIEKGGDSKKLAEIVLATLAITLLNPHVYLDTVVIIGGITATFAKIDRYYFILGALIASFTWFFSLGYFSRYLKPFFSSKRSWIILDTAIGLIMWYFSFSLITSIFTKI